MAPIRKHSVPTQYKGRCDAKTYCGCSIPSMYYPYAAVRSYVTLTRENRRREIAITSRMLSALCPLCQELEAVAGSDALTLTQRRTVREDLSCLLNAKEHRKLISDTSRKAEKYHRLLGKKRKFRMKPTKTKKMLSVRFVEDENLDTVYEIPARELGDYRWAGPNHENTRAKVAEESWILDQAEAKEMAKERAEQQALKEAELRRSSSFSKLAPGSSSRLHASRAIVALAAAFVSQTSLEPTSLSRNRSSSRSGSSSAQNRPPTPSPHRRRVSSTCLLSVDTQDSLEAASHRHKSRSSSSRSSSTLAPASPAQVSSSSQSPRHSKDHSAKSSAHLAHAIEAHSSHASSTALAQYPSIPPTSTRHRRKTEGQVTQSIQIPLPKHVRPSGERPGSPAVFSRPGRRGSDGSIAIICHGQPGFIAPHHERESGEDRYRRHSDSGVQTLRYENVPHRALSLTNPAEQEHNLGLMKCEEERWYDEDKEEELWHDEDRQEEELWYDENTEEQPQYPTEQLRHQLHGEEHFRHQAEQLRYQEQLLRQQEPDKERPRHREHRRRHRREHREHREDGEHRDHRRRQERRECREDREQVQLVRTTAYAHGCMARKDSGRGRWAPMVQAGRAMMLRLFGDD